MVALAAADPRLHVTFNLVPSLIDQLVDLGEGRSVDPALRLARRDAGSLTIEEQLGTLDLFFSVPYKTRIAPFPRYAALFHKRGRPVSAGTCSQAAARFKEQDYQDLMVWFHLAWSGETLRNTPLVRELVRKAEGFTEDDKLSLLEAQLEFLRGIVPHLKEVAAGGSIELSCSPYYHPILPLLCDSDSALEATPHVALPHPAFRRPSDALEQVRSGRERNRQVFGSGPAGPWPLEGFP